MKKFKVTFQTGWRGCELDNTVEKEIKCDTFEQAYYKAKNYDWNPDINAIIIAIEELRDF